MRHQYLKDIVNLSLNVDKCRGCTMCVIVCPHQVFDIIEGKAYIKYKNRCMECGACSKNCPFNAITIKCGVG